MEQQTLIIHSTQAPVRLDMRRRLFRVGEFDESLPFLLRGRIDDGQFAATMHGLNCTLQAPSAMRTLMWLSVIGIWISFGIFLWDITSWNYAYDSFTTTWLFEGLMFFFAVMTIIFSIGYVLNLRKRVDEYLAQANAHYNPLGINFRLEKGYRRWYLVIDIMPQYSSAAGPSTNTLPQDEYCQQAPVMVQPAYYYPNPAGFAPAPQQHQTLPQQQQQMPYGAYSQVAYQQQAPSTNNV
ncbi:uncharacterized protein ACA1_098020 [Acanthamoeba castellanii str. Neff]|uniref:Transmembrane protein n=1 Tax=Acanthamoeba castellanii (strain ATCC 30010 / Neff) TaxID=1257118 RepID=L8GJ95_ACACF|nr:uncharacterized protein ACA1_098020 [Acanthamoeba castellanii str. Neff]ELR13105.1 hypothetical protein ACA1_098020 [Acanthamoeba castellanii str. Neff]